MLAERLTNQRLSRAAASPLDVAHHLLALQGQDLHAVKWALGVRSHSTRSTVEQAFQSGALVRASPLRGTLHVVAADDLQWLQALTSQQLLARAKRRHQQLELTAADFSKATAVAEKALQGRQALTRDAFLSLLDERGVSTAGQRGYHLIWVLSISGVLCWGPLSGNEQCLVLQGDWLPKSPVISRDEALGRLALRYFAGHGPARDADLSWWAGLNKTDARRGIDIAGEALQRTNDGHVRATNSNRAAAVPKLMLLPGFDEYFLGYAQRDPVIEPRFFERVVPGANGIFKPIVVEKGRVTGTWERTITTKKVALSLTMFDSAAPRFEAIARQFAAFSLGVAGDDLAMTASGKALTFQRPS